MAEEAKACFEPVRDALGGHYGRRTYDPGQVFIRDFDVRDGVHRVVHDGTVRRNNSVVYAPGINPLAVDRVDFDQIDFSSDAERKVHVMYRVYTNGEHLAPNTEGFTTFDEFLAWEKSCGRGT